MAGQKPDTMGFFVDDRQQPHNHIGELFQSTRMNITQSRGCKYV